MKVKYLVLVCLSSLLYVANADVSGVGYAQTQSASKKEALADLASNIKSEVRSSFESTTTNNGSKARSNINISSNLPILGADFTFIDRALEVETKVKLTPLKVNALYTQKLYNLNEEIDSVLKEIKKSKSSSLKLKLYNNIFSLLKEYERYESVAIILGANTLKTPLITKAQVKAELAKLDSKIDSVAFAATVLAKSFTKPKIFVYPPFMQNSTTATQFSSVFQKELKSKLRIASTPQDASYILVGEYTLIKHAMVLNYELLNTQTNEVINSKTININKKAYADLQVKPKNIDFDALLNSGVISSSNLKVSLNSNRGSENLLFKSGEEIELFIKLNKMGYFYVVGYTQTKNTKMSYLLELTEGSGDSRFVKFINADDASRWQSLGAFTVEKPFGVESIQVIASNKKITTLPSANYNEDSGYYIISSNIEKALTHTRGLKKKKSTKAEFSESVLTFTTLE